MSKKLVPGLAGTILLPVVLLGGGCGGSGFGLSSGAARPKIYDMKIDRDVIPVYVADGDQATLTFRVSKWDPDYYWLCLECEAKAKVDIYLDDNGERGRLLIDSTTEDTAELYAADGIASGNFREYTLRVEGSDYGKVVIWARTKKGQTVKSEASVETTVGIRLDYPVGGESWVIGWTYDIRWESAGFPQVQIDFSNDLGEAWSETVDAADGSYSWTVTGNPSDQCIVRVSNPAEPTCYAESAAFTTKDYAGTVCYVDTDATGANDGTSWTDAFTHVQDARAAPAGRQVWVAEGTYRPRDGEDVLLEMKDGAAIIGGFVGTETSLADRGDPADHPTVLDGDADKDGTGDIDHVVIGASNAGLNGFTISHGNAMRPGSDQGGGMWNINVSNMVVKQCIFRNNSARIGGGMFSDDSSFAVTNCTFEENTASWSSGGMYNNASSPTVTGSAFIDNSAPDTGGGMRNFISSPTVTNCTFAGNSAGSGGGMHNYKGAPVVTNCTFYGNSAASGGAICNRDNANTTVVNCILWGDSPDELDDDGTGSLTVTYSDVQVPAGVYPGTGNVNIDPLFVSPPGDLHLGTDEETGLSPCIDAASALDAPQADLEGNLRPQGGGVDMGAYERPAIPDNVLYVDESKGDDFNNGRSWDLAKKTIPAASSVISSDPVPKVWEIWVAGGTYKPTSGVNRDDSFQMMSNVGLYGGFAGTPGTEGDRTTRDPATHETILSGDIGTMDDNTDNSYHVIIGETKAMLDGFTITRGNANGGAEPDYWGGGMFNNGVTNLTVRDCVFSNSVASWEGGAMYNSNCSLLTLTRCEFSGNTAGLYGGGGMYNINSSFLALTNCQFLNNSAIAPFGSGGGMYNDDSSSVVTNCTFSGNSSYYPGGGMYNSGFPSPAITGCRFLSNNSTDGNGGGMCNSGCDPTVTDCTFSDNTAFSKGGGMCSDNSDLSVTDCTFSGNIAQNYYGGGMYNGGISTPTIRNSVFSGNVASGMTSGQGGGMYNDTSSPIVTDCTFSGNEATYGRGGGMCNNSSFPVVTNCTFSGNWAARLDDGDPTNDYEVGGGGMHNEESSPVVTNCTFSDNQAEYAVGAGMHNWDSLTPFTANAVITNCTFSGNASSQGGGAIANYINSSPTVTNCILWGDTAPMGAEVCNIDSGTCTVRYSDVQGCGGSGAGWVPSVGTDDGGNIDADPLFVDAPDPDGPDDIPRTADDGLRLGAGSPCIDAADGDAPPEPEMDILGNARYDDPLTPNTGIGTPDCVDMGAYEHRE